MYRFHPQTVKLVELIKQEAIGKVSIIRSNFGFNMGHYQPEHRLFADHTAGGGILDVGCYPVSIARLIAGAASGEPYLEPETVFGVAHRAASGVDQWASALLKFSNGIIAEISCSIMVEQDNMLRIYGSDGRIEVKDFWFASGQKGGVGKIEIFKDEAQQTIEVEEHGWLYSFEIDAAGDAISVGKQQFSSPGMTWADSLGNMRVLDRSERP